MKTARISELWECAEQDCVRLYYSVKTSGKERACRHCFSSSLACCGLSYTNSMARVSLLDDKTTEVVAGERTTWSLR